MTRALAIALVALSGAGLCACGPSAEEVAAREARERRYAAAERAFDRRQGAEAFAAFGAIADDPAFDPATRALARHRQGKLHLRAGREAEARETLSAVAEYGVDERTALAALDAAEMNESHPARRTALLDVARRFPDTGAAEMAVERSARAAELTDAPALTAAFAELAEAHPETTLGPVATRWRAHLQAESGDLPAARTTLRGLTQRWPESGEVPDALRALARLEERRGAWRRARETWDALAGLHPDRGWIGMGSERDPKADDAALRAARVTLHGIGDIADAIRRYRDAIDDFGDGILGDDLRFELALALFAADRPAEAHETLRSLLELTPDSRYGERAALLLDGAPPRPIERWTTGGGA